MGRPFLEVSPTGSLEQMIPFVVMYSSNLSSVVKDSQCA